MPTYRFPPARLRGYFLAVVSFVLIMLVIPTLIAATVTPPEPKTEEVVLDSAATGFSEDENWTIEVPGLRCTPNSETMANQAWDCGATLVQVVSTEGLDGVDEEVAMRRAVRGYAYGEVSTGRATHSRFTTPPPTQSSSPATGRATLLTLTTSWCSPAAISPTPRNLSGRPLDTASCR
ncbi:TPA: hypothetical protein NBR61_000482 [Corynebacterium striatum]|nr:hypothetical protein [Corynebacterium striatum]HCD3161110.1 hypothetical protein [Corynebacterium striatum]HCD3683566.1 hypothetical protein [Corynebacterium striatum]HCD4755493.1 hypothetical protein [Corynebacterium striatum]HCD5913891.1 hypothetical protein [Corynebacterium striatum]